MPDQIFGNLYSHTDAEEDILAHFVNWIDFWLAARERKKGITPGAIARPRSKVIKRSFSTFPGEEQTPMLMLISDGFDDPTRRTGEGRHDAFLRVGIGAVVMGASEGQPHALAGHYAAALVGIAIGQRKINDLVTLSAWSDYTTDDIDDESQSRSMAAVRLELVYQIVGFAHERSHFADVPPNPYDPQPDDPVALTANVEVIKQ